MSTVSNSYIACHYGYLSNAAGCYSAGASVADCLYYYLPYDKLESKLLANCYVVSSSSSNASSISCPEVSSSSDWFESSSSSSPLMFDWDKAYQGFNDSFGFFLSIFMAFVIVKLVWMAR